MIRKIKIIKFLIHQKILYIKKYLFIMLNIKEFLYRKKQLNLLSLSSESKLVLDKILDEGFYKLNSNLYFGSLLDNLYEEAKNLSIKTEGSLKKGKLFLEQKINLSDIDNDSIFLKIALNEKILEIISSYLGSSAYLEEVELIQSLPSEEYNQSQLWHIDRTDNKIIKLFIYCNDVDEKNGPFKFLKTKESKKIPSLVPHYLDDSFVDKHIDSSRVNSVKGEKGTSFIIDTKNCFHMGSRCQKPRLAFIAYYNSGFGYFQRKHDWRKNETICPNKFSKLQKLALDL